jgi:hypothetical protein
VQGINDLRASQNFLFCAQLDRRKVAGLACEIQSDSIVKAYFNCSQQNYALNSAIDLELIISPT